LVAAALLAAGCAAKPFPAATPGSVSPSDSQPPVITESALPSDSTDDSGLSYTGGSSDSQSPSDVENPSDPLRPSSSAPISSPQSADGLADCALPFLRVSVRPGPARSSHAGYLLSFTNTGQIACRLIGYPAVTVLNSSGQPVLRATATPYGYLGGVRGKPRLVVIASGQAASALLEGGLIDLNGNRCRPQPGLRITPPASTVPARVPVATAICGGVQIHPVVAGTTG